MDSFKRDTIVDYTCWDLNYRKYNPKNIKAMIRRKARRKNKLELREVVKEQFYTNAEL